MSQIIDADKVLESSSVVDLNEVKEPPVVVDNTLETVVNGVLSRLGSREVSPQTLMVIVKYAMEAVELTKAKGSEQRDLAIDIVRKIILDAPISDEREQLCLDMISSGVLGQTMDLVIDATNGHLKINDVARLTENCCFSFLNSRNRRRR